MRRSRKNRNSLRSFQIVRYLLSFSIHIESRPHLRSRYLWGFTAGVMWNITAPPMSLWEQSISIRFLSRPSCTPCTASKTCRFIYMLNRGSDWSMPVRVSLITTIIIMMRIKRPTMNNIVSTGTCGGNTSPLNVAPSYSPKSFTFIL